MNPLVLSRLANFRHHKKLEENSRNFFARSTERFLYYPQEVVNVMTMCWFYLGEISMVSISSKAATFTVVMALVWLTVSNNAIAQSPPPDAVLIEKQNDIALRKIVLSMLKEMAAQQDRLATLEGRVTATEERIEAAEKTIKTLDQEIKAASDRVMGSSRSSSYTSGTVTPAPTSPAREVLATFSRNSQNARRLVSIDGGLFVEPMDAAKAAPVSMVSTVCPHCVRCGSVLGVGGHNYGVFYQRCNGRYLMVADQ